MAQSNFARMGEESIGKLLIRFSLPATVGMMVMAAYNIVDAIFVGRLGGQAIAALSVAFPIQMLLGAIAIGTGVGAASLISRSLGAGNKDQAEKAIGQVITLGLLFGLVTALAGFFLLRPLLLFLGTPPEIMGHTEEYLLVITSGSVMFYLIMSLNNVVRAEGNPVLSMYVMIFSALLNIALDPIFIFTLGMGVRGAAVATILAKIAGVVIMIGYFFTEKSSLKLYAAALKLHLKTIAEIYKIGFPAMLLQLSANISLIVANNILAGYGYVPIAVMGLIFRIQMFAFMPVVGISQGLLPIIGFNFGARKLERVREALIKAAGAGTVFLTAGAAAFFAFPGFFLGIFTSEKELLSMGTEAMRIMVIMFPFIGAQLASTTFFQAAGKGIPSLVLSLLREVLFFIPLMLIAPLFLGLTGIWVARPASGFLAFAITSIWIVRELKAQGIPLLPSSGQESVPGSPRQG